MGNRRKNEREDTEASASSLSSASSYTSDDSDSHSKRQRKRKERRRRDGDSRREKRRKKEKERKMRRKEKEERRERRRKKKKRGRKNYESDSESFSDTEGEKVRVDPRCVVKGILKEFPSVGNELKQLLNMVDSGQAVDLNGITERTLKKHLKKLFLSLELKQSGDGIFLLTADADPTLEVVGDLIKFTEEHDDSNPENVKPTRDAEHASRNEESQPSLDENKLESNPTDDSVGPRRRVMGPKMPSAELLAAAAKLTEAQAELGDAELEEDTELFIGPPPPALVTEMASSNEAERFEEVTRIMEAEANSPYDVLGVNHNMSADNMKKRYWKLSLLVHPDKCSHPQAHEAFVLLNKAFKELQDPDKRKALDDKIKQKEEQEAFKVELRAMREAAQWRKSQGIAIEGDEELLAQTEVKEPPKRDEWMTTLPPERKPGTTMHSTRAFSRTTKEGRGDTSAWTDTPLDRAQKAKMNYLEAYNEATALASNEGVQRTRNLDAELVDRYNKEKRPKSLVEKHRGEMSSGSKKKKGKSKSRDMETEKEEWAGKHPWKPWDREKDLVAGRQAMKFDAEHMASGLTSRFSSGAFQRSFL